MPHEHVAAATVRLLKKGGQGVLVEGGCVLTVAHCIEWSGDGGMVLGDYYIEDIETADGTALKASPLAVELMADARVDAV